MGISAQEFRDKTNVSRETFALYDRWYKHLTHWNKTINLVSSTTINNFWLRHAFDSHQLSAYLPNNLARTLDMGSGAGFPGLAVAIALKLAKKPNGAEATLVESNGKKCNFLRAVIRDLDLPSKVLQARAESLPQKKVVPYDVITARAFAPLPKLLGYSLPFWGGVTLGIFPKGASWKNEIVAAKKNWHFDIEIAQSKTDPAAKILLIRDLKERSA